MGAIEVEPHDSKRIYISCIGKGLESNDDYMTTDGELTWEFLLLARTRPVPVIAIDPIDSKIVYLGVGPGFIYRTGDRGQTWNAWPQSSVGWGVPTSIAVSSLYDSVIYVSGTTGIFKTTDEGNTWHMLDLGFGVHSPTLLVLDPRSAETVHVSGLPSPQLPAYSGGIYRSTNGGKSWDKADSGLTDQNKQIMSLAINPKHPDQIFIGI